MVQEIGIINEIGDMGLGFRELSNSDAKKLENAEQQKQSGKQEVINEEKK